MIGLRAPAPLAGVVDARLLDSLATLPGVHTTTVYRASEFQTRPQAPRYGRLLFAHVDDADAARLALAAGGLGAAQPGAAGQEVVVDLLWCQALTGLVRAS
jgi:hypothetical protein